MTLTIHTGFLGGNLFSGLEPETPDVSASCARYAELLTQAIQLAYPGADVRLGYQSNSVGATPYPLQTRVEDAPEEEEEFIVGHVDQISNDVFNDFAAWFVPLQN